MKMYRMHVSCVNDTATTILSSSCSDPDMIYLIYVKFCLERGLGPVSKKHYYNWYPVKCVVKLGEYLFHFSSDDIEV